MKKIIVATFISNIIIVAITHGQITKGNWMLGGTGNFASNKQVAATATTDVKSVNAAINANIGYFLVDKFVTGINMGVESYKARASYIPSSSSNGYSFGPFVKYYLLAADKPFNFFATGNYAYRINRYKNASNPVAKSSGYEYSFAAGPVIFFNSSVGLELSVGWYHNQAIEDKIYTNSIKIGIGLQFYLEKD